ncbi:hypothetical protein AKJ09_07696 [Labilithrix luteola]|uniref:DUF1704 domain-containing protein n=1 Tax=Labilithrix luteola TaxID=1391654 RepID=A0A0K1Q5L9_9BACT|nr:flavohemoglobin expression-modulating QEGLA motif protein [Labilithrix luteola]AKV01033.1 hypothetical protein AKJ09_07696 [Labilithrix luteola]
MTPKEAGTVRASVERVSDALATIKTKANLLEDVAWPREVEEAFFAAKATKLPVVTYKVDKEALEREIERLREVRREIDGDGAVSNWLRSTVTSNIDRNRLLLTVGTRKFGEVSLEVYGGARTAFFDLPTRNVDLADHLLARLQIHGWDSARRAEREMSALDLKAFLEARIQKRKLPITVEVDPKCTSKAIAGMRRVRVRAGATFTEWEAEGLYRHEVETHAFTALNGAAQKYAPLLRSGGPRSTPTQEGLAVFAELYHRAMAIPRLLRLAQRVKLVCMAEDGASFLDVYRHLLELGSEPRDAYLDAARIFRGGPPSGGGVFTKDACYIAGLLHVHAFLAAFVRGGFSDECEMLVAGRFALPDITALVQLRAMGILDRPRYRPRWLRDWSTLLPYFAFTSFLDSIDLEPVAKRYAEVIRIATQAVPC